MFNIEIKNNNEYGPVVSSRTIADELGKRHSDVLVNIEKVIEGFTNKSDISNDIILNYYKAKGRKRSYKEYLVTNQGLIMYFDSFKPNNKFHFFYEMIINNSHKPHLEKKKFMSFDNLFEEIKKSFIKGRGELFYQKVFIDNVEKIFKNVEKMNKNYDKKNIPDAYLILEGLETPVEMKIGNFDLKALNQLQRYMKFYGCKQGLAIGRNLSTLLPDNIMFLDIMELEKFID